MNGYLDAYATVALLLLVGVLIIGGAFTANRLLRPSRPNAAEGKRDTYECGLDPVEGGWAQMQIRYYVYAYLYVLFAVEAVFLFPWAVVYAQVGPGGGRGDGRLRRACWHWACSTPGARTRCAGCDARAAARRGRLPPGNEPDGSRATGRTARVAGSR